MKRVRNTLALACGIVVAAVGCNSGTARLSPVGPSPLASESPGIVANLFGDEPAAGPMADRSAVSPQSDAVVRDAGEVMRWTGQHADWAPAEDLQVSGSGPISGVSGVCPEKTLTIYGVSVVVTAGTTFPIGSNCNWLLPGRTVKVTGVLYATGGITQVLATRIELLGGVNTPVQGEGVVTSMSGCPGTMVIRGTAIVVSAGTQVKWKNGTAATCASIQPGMQVKVVGEVTPDNQVFASSVSLPVNPSTGGTPPTNSTPSTPTTPPPGTTPTGGERVGGSGVASTVTGTCPAISFVVFGTTVRATSATRFSGGSCSQIRTGTRVEVEGTRTNGVVTATKVHLAQ